MSNTTTNEAPEKPIESAAVVPSLPAFSCDRLERTFPASRKEPARKALDGVSLSVNRGEWLSLLGPNGSGKSTLLRIIATLDTPDTGTMTLLGELQPSGGALRSVRARLGVVFQRPGLDGLLTIRENLLLQAAMLGMERSEAEHRVRAAATAMGVSERLNSRIATLSGGLVRRADLARALLGEPELLLLDEPTTGLDLEARAALLDLLDQRRLASLKTITIIMTTHHMDEAERGTRVALMHEGRLAAEGKPSELRRALGGHVIVTRPENVQILESAGLTITRSAPEAVGAGSPEAVERAAVELTRAAASFSVGPPTLADVYFAHTGSRLTDRSDA